MNARVLMVFAMLGLAGCAENRYRWNLTHAYVTPWTHLSPADHDAIVRLISYRDQMPIIGITHHRPSKDGSTISVFTGNVNQLTYSYYHGYDLEKENGTWRITFHGDASHTITGLSLSEQEHELEERRH